MREPVWYGEFTISTREGKKTPRFTTVKEWGKYPPMEALRGCDGKISLYLLESIQSGSKESTSTPPIKLQAKGSLNLTGLKNYYVGGEISGYAYGNPYDKPTYGKSERANPFVKNYKDGFLFRFKFENGSNIPIGFEMIVIPSVDNLIKCHCEMLIIGGYNQFLEEVRKEASDNPLSLI